MFDNKNLITVWSAPNYCYRCGNIASILVFDENMDREIRLFKEVEQSGKPSAQKMGVTYFY